METNEKTLILINNWFGHTFTYLKVLIPILVDRGYRLVSVTDNKAQASIFFDENFPNVSDNVLQVDMADSWHGDGGPPSSGEAHWEMLGKTLAAVVEKISSPVGILHLWMDLKSVPYLKRDLMQKVFPCRWAGLCIHPAEFRIRKTWKRRAFEGVKRRWTTGSWPENRLAPFRVDNLAAVFCLDEGLVDNIKKYFGAKTLVQWFPELTDFRLPDEVIPPPLALRPGERLLSVAGFLAKRKGLLHIIRVAKRRPAQWRFLILGEIIYDGYTEAEISEIRSFVASPPENAIVIPKNIQCDAEFNWMIKLADVHYLAYEGFFHSSGIQIKAAAFNKPSIFSADHLMSERAREYNLGWILREHSPQALEELLESIDDAEYERVCKNAKFDEFLKMHSPEKVEQALDALDNAIFNLP